MNGVLSPWTRDQYDADESRVRSTRMKDLVSPQGPRAYWLKHLRAREPELSDPNDDYSPKVGPLVIGRLFHELVLEGKVGWFVTKYRRGSQDWKRDCRRNAGQVALSAKDDAMMWAWNEALQRNAEVQSLLAQNRYEEQVITWEEEVTFQDGDGIEHTVTVPAKCAIDIFTHTGRIACLKTTRIADIADDKWIREVEQRHYHFSAAFYERGVLSLESFHGKSLHPMTHIVLCKPVPHAAYVQQLDDEFMRFGRQEIRLAFERYARCMHDLNNGMDPLAAWPDMLERNQLDPATPSMRAMERYGKLAGEAV